ncbi:hypothetical protein M6K221_2613 [Staphylococcus aureus]|nr:hypothetical protein M6K068_2621 [Staphylococcus aureus]GCA24381.1 hypothetical protein M6K221_2613 [Staphylococcus aureus]
MVENGRRVGRRHDHRSAGGDRQLRPLSGPAPIGEVGGPDAQGELLRPAQRAKAHLQTGTETVALGAVSGDDSADSA